MSNTLREFLRRSVIGAEAALLPPVFATQQSKAPERVVVCIADDLGWHETGYNATQRNSVTFGMALAALV